MALSRRQTNFSLYFMLLTLLFVRIRCIWYVMVSSFIRFDFSWKMMSSDSDEYLRAISHKCLSCISFSFYKEFLCFLYSTFLISKQNLLLFTLLGFISIHFPCNIFSILNTNLLFLSENYSPLYFYFWNKLQKNMMEIHLL